MYMYTQNDTLPSIGGLFVQSSYSWTQLTSLQVANIQDHVLKLHVIESDEDLYTYNHIHVSV